MNINFKNIINGVGEVLAWTFGIWGSYWAFKAVNQLGLALRGPIMEYSPQDWVDKQITTTSSLGIIFFVVVFVMFCTCIDTSGEEGAIAVTETKKVKSK